MAQELITIGPGLSTVPYLDQYAGTWAIEERAFAILSQKLSSFDIAGHLNSAPVQALRNGRAYDPIQDKVTVSDGVGIVSIGGVLMKQQTSMSGGTSTVLARRAIRMLAAEPDVKSIVLHIDSPGGTSAGTMQLGDEVRLARKSKPVYSYIEDLGASAAYWVASQAQEIVANEPAKVGSIGTYLVVHDLSKAAEMEGIKVHVIRAGDFKGQGVPGTELTEANLADLQRTVDGVNEFFLQAVSSGRGLSMEKVRELADGRVHFAKDAKGMGLIDSVETFDDFLGRLKAQNSVAVRSQKMADEAKAVATIGQIKAACPGIDSDLVLTYAEAGKSLEECTAAFMQELATENAALKEQNAELQAKLDANEAAAKKVEQSTLGVKPLEHSSGKSSDSGGSATEQFWALVKERQDAGMSKSQAMKSVVHSNAELHREFLAEANRR